MPSYTTSLRLAQPSDGETNWGATVNTGVTAVVDKAVAGITTVTMTAANYILTNANGVADEAKSMFLVLGGTPGASLFVIVPTASKLYFVTNNTGFAQSVSTSASGGVSVPNGASMVLRCDGTNVVEALTTFGNLTYTGTLTGGTGVVNIGSGQLYKDASGNLGIGTSSPGAKLDVVSGTGSLARFTRGSIALSAFIGASEAFWGTDTNHPLVFTTNGAEKARLDSSGNLGIGTGSPAQRLDVTGVQNSVQARFGNVAGRGLEIGTALIAGTNDAGSVLNAKGATSGTMIFQTDSTERMRLNASGRLGIGTASPGFPLHVVNPQGSPQIAAGDGNVVSYVAYSLGTGASAVNYYGTGSNHAQAFLVNNVERGRFNTAGALGLGTDVPRGDLDVGTPTATAITKSIHLGFSTTDFYGFRIANTNTASVTYAGTLAFQRGTGAAWADVVTITDGGNLLVNTSTIAGAGGYTFQIQADGIATVNNNNSASTGYVFSSYRRGGTEIGSITQNGTTAVLFNTTSDRRLKDNIVPAPSASDVIDAIEIVSHDWKAAPDEHVTYGVIAQDLALVAPQAVLQGNDGEEIEKTWGVDYSKLVPMLIKEIQSLRARVATLEAA